MSRELKEIDGLNEMQRKFADEFLILGNRTQAAIKAGYSKQSAHAQGCTLLKHPKVKKYIEERRKNVAEDLNLSFIKVMSAYREIAFPTEDGKGKKLPKSQVKNISTKDRLTAIEKLKEYCFPNQEEESSKELEVTKITTTDANGKKVEFDL